MSDGPFRNLKLGSRWKRFAEAVQNDAVDETERCALASDALVREILSPANRALLAALNAYSCEQQLDIDPQWSVEIIFNNHYKSPFADTLQKELTYRLSDKTPVDVAIEQALASSIADHICEVKNRIEEECIRACETREMKHDQFERTVNHSAATLDQLDREAIYDAVLMGNIMAFKGVASKKENIHEGPSL